MMATVTSPTTLAGRTAEEATGQSVPGQGLERCHEDGVPAYLEASSPRNRALYERHGFEVLAEVRAEDSPPLWPMLRPAS